MSSEEYGVWDDDEGVWGDEEGVWGMFPGDSTSSESEDDEWNTFLPARRVRTGAGTRSLMLPRTEVGYMRVPVEY